MAALEHFQHDLVGRRRVADVQYEQGEFVGGSSVVDRPVDQIGDEGVECGLVGPGW